MNCLGCGYLLWNLPPGACPECGRGFKPSDFEFRHCAVQYACPHCEQVYYGTDEKGHLIPQRFTCVSCGGAVEMDAMTVRPQSGWDEQRTARQRNRWVDRRREGWIRGWLATIGQAMVTPARLITATPATGGSLEAGAFVTCTTVIYHAVGSLPLLLFVAAMAVVTGGAGSGGGAAWGGVVAMAGFMLIPIVATVVFVPLWTLVAHGILRLTGPLDHGLGRTWQALCYGGGANWAVMVPCVGMYIFWIGWGWWIVSSSLMLAQGQSVGGLRASCAVLLLPVVVVGGTMGFVGWQVYDSMSTISSLSVAPTVSMGSGWASNGNVQALASGLLAFQARHGRPPVHALEMVSAGGVSAGTFVDPMTMTMPSQVPAGRSGQTLSDLMTASASGRAAVAQAAASALPAKVIAHRVGDYVFTYHGVSLASPQDPRLWLVIMSPEPAVNAQSLISQDLWVGDASGSVTQVGSAAFASELKAQNQLRAVYGLAPLPDPATVTDGHPAVGP